MSRFFHPLMYLLACATRQELARQVQYLKVENEILRSKLPKKLTVTPDERWRLVRAGRKLGTAIKELITIVSPRTFARWVSGQPEGNAKPAKKVGRRRTPEDVRDLVIQIATETGWGYTRILGELRKLGIRKISRQTVVRILKEHGFDPGPKRGKGTWDEFIKIHAQTLWACDFLSKKVSTIGGLVDLYVLVFINVGSRKVWVSPPTAHPNSAWVAQQARNVCMHFQDEGQTPSYVMRDADTKYTRQFDGILESEGINVKRHTPMSPNLNAYVERFIQSIQQECLDHFIVCGERHFDYLIREYIEHYHTERPHQGKENEPLIWDSSEPPKEKPKAWKASAPPPDVVPNSDIKCRQRLGGLLKHYSRKAA